VAKRRRFQLVLLDVEQRAQVVAHALAVCNADRFLFEPAPRFFPRDRRLKPGRRRIWPIDDDPQYCAYRLTAQLDVEHFESVAPRDALGGRPDVFQLLPRWRRNDP
jgi:hypothetical protein